MLALNGISTSGDGTDSRLILDNITASYPLSHFGAIIGPSGCGKSTLLKSIAGIMEIRSGEIQWLGKTLSSQEELDPADLGYVPQFSILHDELTVEESIRYAIQLRVGSLGRSELVKRSSHLLRSVGMEENAASRTSVLSGGQKRRLGLALELVSTPGLLLCDEVTSGLDLKSEDEIVQLLKKVSLDDSRLVLCVTHSLRHLHLFDSVTFLYQGKLIYQGPSGALLDYFSADSTDTLFNRLVDHDVVEWENFWKKNRNLHCSPEQPDSSLHASQKSSTVQLPGFFTQSGVLLKRRLQLFFRSRDQLWLQISLLLIFPVLVSLFAYEGLPQIRNMEMNINSSLVQELTEALSFNAQLSKIGSLVSGVVMFQVILIALMASNNAAREVISTRILLEKEKLGGLRVGSYLFSILVFFTALVLIQSAWMSLFVKEVCGLPGDVLHQFGFIFMVNATMTCSSLAISSWAKTTEQASLMSVYLVGFQLPLSGAVLALPEGLGVFIRPLIAAYWSWSGYLQTLKDTRFYDLVVAITNTPLSSIELSYWVLCVHVLLGVALAYFGCVRSQFR